MGVCVAIDAAELAREHAAVFAARTAVACARACDAFGVDDVVVCDSRAAAAAAGRGDDDDDDDDKDDDKDEDVRGVREVSARGYRARDFLARACDAVSCPRALRELCVRKHDDLKWLGATAGGANGTRDKANATCREGVVVADDDGGKSSFVVDCGRGARYRVVNAKRAIRVGTRVTVRPKKRAKTREDDDDDDANTNTNGDQYRGVDDKSECGVADVVSPEEAKAHMGSVPFLTRALERGALATELEKYALVVVVDETLMPSPSSGADDDDADSDVLTDIATRAKTENVLVMFGEVARLFRAESVDVDAERSRRAIIVVDAFGRTRRTHVVESQSTLRVDESMWVVLARLMLH